MDETAKQDTALAVASLNAGNRLADTLAHEGIAESERDSFERLTAELANAPEGYPSAQALQALEDGDAEKALALCDSVERQVGDSSVPLSLPLVRGRALLALKRADEAAEEFHRVLRQEPECPAALKGLGDTYFVQNKEVIAFTYYERARELSGDYRALAEKVRFTSTKTATVSPDPTFSVPTPIALEEIIVRDSVDEPRDEVANDSHVSLTMKRAAEEPTLTKDAEQPAPPEQPVPPEQSERRAVETRPSKKPPTVELSERYDRVKRPAHYQTETMADLLLQQGYTDAALDILRVLVQKNPLQRLQEKLAQAESRQKRK